jgi:DoxX-like protein
MSLSLFGQVLVLLVAAVLLLDGILQLASPPTLIRELVHIGFPPNAGPRIAIVTLSGAILLAVPQSALIGAVLATGFLGGAICSHVRVGEIAAPSQLVCVSLGTAMWIGLCFAEPGLAGLLP